MAIVKMKRLRLLALRPEREKLLHALQSLGCVEIREPAIDLSDPKWEGLAKPESAGLEKAREQSLLLSGALDVLRRYAPSKDGLFARRPEVTEGELFDESAYAEGLAAARQVMEAEQALAAKTAEKAKLQTQRASLEPWTSLDVPLEEEGTATVPVHFCSAPLKTDFAAMEAAVGQATELAQLVRAGSDRELQYFLLICHHSALTECNEAMRPYGASRVTLRGWTGTAAENAAKLDNRVAALEREEEQCRDGIAALGEKRNALRRCVDRASQEISREENKARLIDTDATFILVGWLPAENEAQLQTVLGGFQCAWETADPTRDEYPEVPIKLKNNPVTAPFNAITEMYAMPAYDSVDPNPLMAPFFILFFGFMMNDIAYGLLMVLGTALFLSKAKPKGGMKNMMAMFFMCGISSIFWGCLTGGFFGDFLPKLFELTGASVPGYYEAGAFVWFWKPLFTPINDIILVMIGSMILGVIQVFTGMAVSVEEKFRHGSALDAITQEIAWYCILIGAAIAIAGSAVPGMPAILGTVGLVVLVLGFVLLLVGNLIRAKGLGGVIGFGGDIYNGVSGYFGDILSYLRLMALMMAGSIIASVFNTLGSVFGLVPFIIVAIIGNALNLVLNLLGCYVHTMRLQCLEFFGRFYQDGGKPFRPLAVETKYVDILKEEM
ncbi:MAG: V-type ATP synthase subunit I [Oscillospiraceae bacterium]|nr:V-type ATP synthase subunit I [Oscillospiraceae bacterium]MDE7170705.1 V-type ATP synthase subunit I [Oscillospiraceae bacterium]